MLRAPHGSFGEEVLNANLSYLLFDMTYAAEPLTCTIDQSTIDQSTTFRHENIVSRVQSAESRRSIIGSGLEGEVSVPIEQPHLGRL